MFKTDDAQTYVSEFAVYEKRHFENVAQSTAGVIVKDEAYLKDQAAFRQRPDVAFLEDKYRVFERFAIRLNDDRAWFDCLTFQYASDRGNISQQEHV